MNEAAIRVEYRLAFTEAFHLGSGYGRGLLDRLVVRDARGHVYIPGSSIKGKIRSMVEALARSKGVHVCTPPRPERMCRENPCLSCRIFGSPRRDGTVFFSDAVLPPETKALFELHQSGRAGGQALLRTQVQLSRFRGVACDGLLFTSEYAEPGLEFSGTVKGLIADDPSHHETAWLVAGMLSVDAMGGGKSRGLGQCRFSISELRLNDEKLSVESLLSDWAVHREKGA